MKPSQVNKIIRQYYDAILKIVNKIDPCSITHDQYLNLIKKGIYVPGLGIFELNWKHIEAWQNKNKKTKKND